MLGDTNNKAQDVEKTPARTIGLIVAAVVVIALVVVFAFVRRHQSPNAPEQVRGLDAYAANLAISSVQMSEAQSVRINGKNLYVDGAIKNNGAKTVTAISVQAIFHGADGAVVYAETLPLPVVRTREPYVDTQQISAAPILAGQARDFRLIFEGIPDTWNSDPPEIRPVRVTTK